MLKTTTASLKPAEVEKKWILAKTTTPASTYCTASAP